MDQEQMNRHPRYKRCFERTSVGTRMGHVGRKEGMDTTRRAE